jgi:hypothetical protein
MKTRILLVGVFAALLLQCSNEEFEPEPLAEDMATASNAYEDQFLTIMITCNADREFTFYLTGNGGNVSVNWGDGTIQKHVIGPDPITLRHRYTREINYTIRVSGDILTITQLDIGYENLAVRNIHFGGVSNIRSVTLNQLPNGPASINLSRNKKIESVVLASIKPLREVLLSTTNNISLMDIAGSTNLSTAVVDKIVARIHDSVISRPRFGYFGFNRTWALKDMSRVGPPSSYSINKLRKLRNVYDWTVYPDVP